MLNKSLDIMEIMKNHGLNDIQPERKSENLLRNKLKYFKLLKNRIVLVPIICIGIFNLGGNIKYYALNYSIDSTGNSYGTSIFLFGVVECIALFPMSKNCNT